jgi:arylsulfatase A-like enzyme
MHKKKAFFIVFFVILVILIAVIAIYLRSNQKNFFESTVKKEIIRSSLADIPILVPKDMFSQMGFFFARNRAVVNLNNDEGFVWRIPRDFNGELVFRLCLYLNDLPEELSQVPNVSEAYIQIRRKREQGISILFERKISPVNFKRRIFIKLLRKKNISLKKGDELEFAMRISPSEIDGEYVKFGITVPKLIDKDRMYAKKFNNLIIISIDTLRADYLGIYKKLYGEKFQFSFSPNLDQFARESVIFKNAYTPQTSTWPALASLMVSRYPFEHGVLYNGDFIKSKYESIATHMLNMGYQTLSLHGNAYHLNVPGIEEKYNFFNRDFALIDFSIERMNQYKDRPFFHWYHFLGVHSNYTPPQWVHTILKNNIEKDENKEFIQNFDIFKIMEGKEKINDRKLKYIKTSYAGELYHLDFKIKKIFDFLKSYGLWDDAMIVVTSDHGEDLYEHNKYFLHYPSIYETSLRIPLMIKFPKQKEQLIIEEPVSILDIFPTIFEYFHPEDFTSKPIKFSGNSLIPLIEGDESFFERRILYAGTWEFKIISAIKNNWKLIYNPDELTPSAVEGSIPYPIQKIEFYNVADDFQEKDDIQGSYFEVAQELIENIIRFKEKMTLGKETVENEDDYSLDEKQKKEIEENLKALGYIK